MASSIQAQPAPEADTAVTPVPPPEASQPPPAGAPPSASAPVWAADTPPTQPSVPTEDDRAVTTPAIAPRPSAAASATSASVDGKVIATAVRAKLSDPEQPCAEAAEPPLPDPAGWDWLRYVTDEWLKGDLKEMRDDSLTFDSDQIDLVTEDWEDIAEFRSSRNYTYVDVNLVEHTGPALITQKTVTVRTESGIHSFPRDQLLSIVPGNGRELDRWSLKLTLGSTLRRGNTETADLSSFFRLKRQDTLTRWLTESNTQLGAARGQLTAQNWNGTSKVDIFFSRAFFATPLFGTGQHDKFKNIRFRGSVGAGAGAHMVEVPRFEWDLALIPAYQRTRYLSVQAGRDIAVNDAVLVLHTAFETDPTDDIDFDISWQTYLAVTNVAHTYHHGTAVLSLEITDVFDLDVSAIYDRVEDPPPREDGTVPKRNDISLTVGIGIDLE